MRKIRATWRIVDRPALRLEDRPADVCRDISESENVQVRPARYFLIVAILAVSAARGDNEIVGKIELTIDGKEQTWYVLEPDGDMLPNALWLAMGPDKAALSITAYEDPDIAFVRHEATGSPLPAGDAAALVLSVAFPPDAGEYAYELPTGPNEGPATIMMLANWSNPLDGYVLDDGPGEIRLTRIDASKDGPSAFSGTFHGVMRHESGESRAIEDGRFEIRRAKFFARD